MNATDHARWNRRELLGFWFLANFPHDSVGAQLHDQSVWSAGDVAVKVAQGK